MLCTALHAACRWWLWSQWYPGPTAGRQRKWRLLLLQQALSSLFLFPMAAHSRHELGIEFGCSGDCDCASSSFVIRSEFNTLYSFSFLGVFAADFAAVTAGFPPGVLWPVAVHLRCPHSAHPQVPAGFCLRQHCMGLYCQRIILPFWHSLLVRDVLAKVLIAALLPSDMRATCMYTKIT
eukprot:365288-Chlamydomonas_euryale.AAC.2